MPNPISKEDMVNIIAKHEVFSGLTEEQLMQLMPILSFKSVEKDQTIFEVGDRPEHIFYLLNGALTLNFPDKSKLNLLPHELIGEIGILNGDFRLGQLISNAESELIAICATKIFNPKIVSSDISLKIVRRLSKRVTNYLRSIQQTSTKEIISKGENDHIEFKSTLRWNLKADRKDPRITHAVLKTIAAFLNSAGGTLIVGVADDGDIIGLEKDRFVNEDKLLLFLTSVIKDKLGTLHLENIFYHTEIIDDKMILRVDVQAGNTPCYIPDEKLEHLYIRTGPATTDLQISKVFEYIVNRFYSGKVTK